MTASDELLLKLKPLRDHSLIRIGDESAVLHHINTRFPFRGSKIDWKAVPGSVVERISSSDELTQCRSFLAKHLRGTDPTTLLTIVGDGAMNFSIETRLSDVGCCVDEVLRLPQHTYITTARCEWCLVFTMEGDMCFGYAPTPDAPPSTLRC